MMNKRIKKVTLLFMAVLGMSLPVVCSATGAKVADASAASDLTSMAPIYKDVVFASVKNDDGAPRDLKMNIFKPQATGETVPVLVFIHGGGWAIGDYQGDDAPRSEKAPAPAISPASAQFAAGEDEISRTVAADSAYKVFKRVLNDGIAFVSIDYRLSGEAAFPAQIYDVKGAIRFLRAHADEYGIDPNRIAVAGNSAGGHLAMELATTGDIKELEGDVGGNLDYSSEVMAVVDYYGPTDLFTMGPEMDPDLQSPEAAFETHDSPQAAEATLLGFDKEGQGVAALRELREQGDTTSPYWSKVELAELASPIQHVTPNDPPAFIAHGGRDFVVPIEQSLRIRDALNKVGVENIFMSNSKAPHGDQGEYVNRAAIAWITAKLLESK